MDQPVYPITLIIHSVTLLLVYAYVKEELTFSFLYVLSPSILLIMLQFYQFIKKSSGLQRAKFIITGVLLVCFVMALTKAIKDEGGMDSDMDDDKWLVKHRRCFQLMILAMFSYSFLSFIDSSQPAVSSLLKDVLLNIFSSLSMPLTICSGGACNSIYISTVTSILSSFSVPLAMVVPVLNIIGYLLQLVGLFSLYSANKWRSIPFWIYVVGMILQLVIAPWFGAILMIVAVVMNAKTNKFVYGKKIFKESVV